jgi:hypothetical protein
MDKLLMTWIKYVRLEEKAPFKYDVEFNKCSGHYKQFKNHSLHNVTASGEFVYTDVKQRKNFWKLQTN